MPNNTSTANQVAVRDVVVARYLDECKSSSVKEISVKLGWSESKVRRQFDQAPGGVIGGLSPRRDERFTYSRNFQTMEVVACWVSVYEPALWYLRDLLLVERLATRVLEMGIAELRDRWETPRAANNGGAS